MGNIKRFAAINTKIMALEGKLLSNDDFQNLLTKKSVTEVAEYLKENTAYQTMLKDIDLRYIEADELEILFKKYIVGQLEKLIHYFTGEYRRLFRILFLRYEIEDLKVYLRTVMREGDLSKAKEFAIFPDKYASFDRERLMQSKNLEDFIENLKGTEYYQLLKPYLNEKPEKRLFYMEMVLDKQYFKMLSEQTEKLDIEDRKIMKELLGKNIDLLNLQWIYRGLRFYQLSPEELINYTLHNGYVLKYSKIKELCYSKNEEELIDKMIHSKYGFLFDNKDTLEIFMERRIERYLYFLFLEYKRREKMNIIESSVYRHLLEFEMRDIFSIIEAIKYGLGPEESKKFLIRKI
ncbi:MAG: V-type ATPase subunit [Bacillota bacterium]